MNPSPLRVLQLITDRDRRGGQVYALDLAGGMQSLGLKVHTLALIPGRHGDLLPVDVMGRWRFSVRATRKLRRVARGYDVVIAHGSSTLLASVLALRGLDITVVYRQISDPEFWAGSWSRRLRVAGYLRQIDAIVALSPSIASTFQRHYWLRSRPGVTVIPNAVPEDRFRPADAQDRATARAQLGLPADGEVILYIGALAPEKGVEVVIAAAAARPGAALLVVGDGPRRAQLDAEASRRMPGRARFAGALSDPQVAYWAADVLAFPSQGGDSMPAVLIEAGLSGLASVTTDIGATADVVDHGTTGLVVPLGDAEAFSAAVSELLCDSARRSEMGPAAVVRCGERFTIGRTAPAWRDLLCRLRAS